MPNNKYHFWAVLTSAQSSNGSNISQTSYVHTEEHLLSKQELQNCIDVLSSSCKQDNISLSNNPYITNVSYLGCGTKEEFGW